MRSSEAVEAGDAVSAELAVLLARLSQLADAPVDDSAISGAARIDRIALYEQIRAALAAAQHTEMVGFARTRVDEQSALIAAGSLDPRQLGRGVADEIALAAHVSSWQGSRRLGVARALASDLPETQRLLA